MAQKIKILIVEDEVLIAEYIKLNLNSFGFSEIYMAHNKKNALDAIEFIKPDLALLDIRMQGNTDGIEIAKQIDTSSSIPYIFITANSDIIIIQEAVKTNAVGYITKPIKKSDLFASVQIALNGTINKKDNFFIIKFLSSIIKINYDDIKYIESSGNYINIYTKEQQYTDRRSLEWAEDQLPRNQFMRVHRSFLVNMHLVNKKSSNAVFIMDVEIPVSRTYSHKLSNYFNQE